MQGIISRIEALPDKDKSAETQADTAVSDNNETSQSAEATASADQQSDINTQANADISHDTWPLEADRLALQSPLTECLRVLAGHYGRRTSFSSRQPDYLFPKRALRRFIPARRRGRI